MRLSLATGLRFQNTPDTFRPLIRNLRSRPMNFSRLVKAVTVLAFLGTLGSALPALADTFSVQYFKIPAGGGNGDFYNGGSPGGTSNNFVVSTLGPDGRPVYNTGATATSGSISAPTDVNSAGEILWWTAGQDSVVVDTAADLASGGTLDVTPGGVNMYPAGQGGSDSPDEETALLTGSFTLTAASSVSFSVGADDDAFVYVDGQLVEDLGGIHGDTLAPTNAIDLGIGSHTIQIFYADQEETGASLSFDDNAVALVTPAVPEPSSLALLGTGVLAVGGMVRRRFVR
jgi:fibro-slime domain-containing protein